MKSKKTIIIALVAALTMVLGMNGVYAEEYYTEQPVEEVWEELQEEAAVTEPVQTQGSYEPEYQPEAASQPQPEPEIVPQPEAVPQVSEPQQEVVPEFQPEPEPEIAPQSEVTPQPEVQPEAAPQPEEVSQSEFIPQPEAIPQALEPQQEVVPELQPEPEQGMEPELDVIPQQDVMPQSQPEPQQEVVPQSEETPQQEIAPQTEEVPQQEPIQQQEQPQTSDPSQQPTVKLDFMPLELKAEIPEVLVAGSFCKAKLEIKNNTNQYLENLEIVLSSGDNRFVVLSYEEETEALQQLQVIGFCTEGEYKNTERVLRVRSLPAGTSIRTEILLYMVQDLMVSEQGISADINCELSVGNVRYYSYGTWKLTKEQSAEVPQVQPEAEPQKEPEQPEAEPQEEPEQPEAEPQEEPEQPEAEPQEEPEQPEAEPQEEPEQPEAESQEEPEQPEAESQEEPEQPEAEPQEESEQPKEEQQEGSEEIIEEQPEQSAEISTEIPTDEVVEQSEEQTPYEEIQIDETAEPTEEQTPQEEMQEQPEQLTPQEEMQEQPEQLTPPEEIQEQPEQLTPPEETSEQPAETSQEGPAQEPAAEQKPAERAGEEQMITENITELTASEDEMITFEVIGDGEEETEEFEEYYEDWGYYSDWVTYSDYEGVQINTATPYVLVKSYSHKRTINTGDAFGMEITFLNTSQKVNMENVVIKVETSDSLSLANGTNTLFVPGIEAGGTTSQTLNLLAAAECKDPTQKINLSVSFEYIENKERKQGTATESITIPVSQKDRLELRDPVIDEMQAGKEGVISLSYVNKGYTSLYNMEASLELENADAEETIVYAGNVESGKSGSLDFLVTPQEEGEYTGQVTLTYEDASQSQVSVVVPLTFTSSMAYVEEYDYFEDEMFEYEEEQAGMPITTVMIIAGAVLAAVAVILCLVRRKRKIKAENDIVLDDWFNDKKEG